jgi:hypothetical protein
MMSKNVGIIGVSDHGGRAVLVTLARDGTLPDRRRVAAQTGFDVTYLRSRANVCEEDSWS